MLCGVFGRFSFLLRGVDHLKQILRDRINGSFRVTALHQ